jgi:hypothetical protein
LIATHCKATASQQPVLAVNVSRLLAELHQLAATNALAPEADHRARSAGDPAMVIRGK